MLLSLSCEISITCALTFFTSNNHIISQFLKERFGTLLKLKNNSQTSACSFLQVGNHCSKLLIFTCGSKKGRRLAGGKSQLVIFVQKKVIKAEKCCCHSCSLGGGWRATEQESSSIPSTAARFTLLHPISASSSLHICSVLY